MLMFRKNKNQTKTENRSRMTTSYRRNAAIRVGVETPEAPALSERQQYQEKSYQRRKIKRKVLGFLFLLLVGIILWRMNIQAVNISTVAPYRISAELEQQYIETANSIINKSVISRQVWLLDKTSFNNSFLSSHPEVRVVELKSRAPFQQKLQINLQFRTPVFSWHDVSKSQLFVDQYGVLFNINNNPLIKESNLVQIEDESGIVLEPGSPALTSTLVEFIGKLNGEIPKVYGGKTEVEKIVVPRSTREVSVKVTTYPYLIKLSTTRDLEKQISELKLLLKELQRRKVTPRQYIDLRVEHRAFYK